MARKHLTAALAIAGVVLAVPAAQAAYAVLDSAMVAKAAEQIKELKSQVATELEQLGKLKESVGFLTDIAKFAGDVSDAIGTIANITLPIPNIEKMRAQIKSDMRCLMPEGVKWGIKFEELNLASICETSSKYREALFVDQKKLMRMGFNEQEAARRIAAAHRTALLEDTALRSLAQGDVQLQQADKLTSAADDLQTALGGATTVQDRLHVQAQANILQARAAANQNAMLAQMLKLQAAAEIKAGLPADKVAEITGEDGKK